MTENAPSPQIKVVARFLRRVIFFLIFAPAINGFCEEVTKEEITQPLDIRAPGSDLANFPNSAFTLPQGGFYLETVPMAYASSSSTLAAQYNWEYLLRYGLFDWLELRLYSQGLSVQGNPQPATGFSPLTFDTKIHFWDENQDYYLPAAGLEVLVQTNVLGSTAFNSGVEPSFSLNFDQMLPWWDLQIEYNLGAARFEDPQNTSNSVWDFTFAWAIQKELVKDFSVFLNGYYNAANLPRIGRVSDKQVSLCPTASTCRPEKLISQTTLLGGNDRQNALGVGSIWTISDNLSLFANFAGGLTRPTPSFISFVGFAWTP